MKFSSIEEVARYGLCAGCGVCKGVCPNNAIEMIEDRKLTLSPKVNDNCNRCELCIRICPGIENFGEREPELVDYGIKKAWVAHAIDPGVRHTGQSGGSITALLMYALKTDFCSGVLVTGEHSTNPLKNRCFVARTSEQILSAAKSKYCPVDWGSGLKDIQEGDCLIAVGTPCQLRSLRNVQEWLAKKLRVEIKLFLGLVCDGIMNRGFQEFALRHANIKDRPIQFVFKDKEFGWPGDLKIKTASKTIFLPNTFRTRVKNLFRPDRCRICIDKLNSSADLIFGDAYLENLAEKEKGYSLIGARTEKGQYFLELATKAGILFANELPTATLLQCHKPELRRFTAVHYRRPHHLINRRLPYLEQESSQYSHRLTTFQKMVAFFVFTADYLAVRLFLHSTVRVFFSCRLNLAFLRIAIRFRNKAFSYVWKQAMLSSGS